MKRMLLIRDQSTLSQDVEKFLKENNYQYDILYSNEKEQLPAIFEPNSSFPYTGKKGFEYFKAIHN